MDCTGGYKRWHEILFFWGGDIVLRSAALCEPSPGDTVPTHLPIEVGRRKIWAEGGYWQYWRMGRVNNAVQQFFFMASCTRGCTMLVCCPTQGKNQAMQPHRQDLPPCNYIAWFPAWEQMHIESLHHQMRIGGGNLITKLAGECGSCF